jgi:cytochrome c oxidase cbb3-type subunit 3
MSSFWSWFIAILTVVNILACFWLINWTSKKSPGETDTTGHVWDRDLKEWNNPLPRWWLWMFYITIVFSLAYLVLYPGLGKFAGALGWTQENQYEGEVAQAEASYAPLYQRYAATPIPELARNAEALQTGKNLYVNNCAQCHGSDARGAIGFPNLTDGEWLYGGEPETIKASIINGRNGVMPPWGPALGEEGVGQVTEYVLKLSGNEHDAALAAEGQAKFAMFCVSCHGPDGKGMAALGAPNLTNDIWLYGGGRQSIARIITNGLNNMMPAQGEILGEDRAHVVAAYVYSLSEGGAGGDKAQ